MQHPVAHTRRHFARCSAAVLALPVASSVSSTAETVQADVCVYAATASGIAAAMGAADTGMKVVVVEPSRWLGGMSGGGLNAIDWGDTRAVGAMARQLLIEKDDVGKRALYKRELARRDIPVLYELRIADTVRDGARIRSIALDHAPPDALG